MVISFKTAPGAILAIQCHIYKIVCFKDIITGRLKVDLDATVGGKQNPALQGSRIILIYKTYMHTESALDPERCAHKSDPGMRFKWIIKQIQQVDQHEDCVTPPHQMGVDEDMEEDAQPVTDQEHTEQDRRGAAHGAADGAAGGSGQQHTKTMQDYIRKAAKMPIRQVPREELGTLPTFTIPFRASSGPAAVGTTATKLKNTYAPLEPLGSGAEERDSDRMSFSSVSGVSVGSGSRGSRGRDPIPLTPEILHFLDRLEPDKGK